MAEGRGQELFRTQMGAPGNTQLPLLEDSLAKVRVGPLWYYCWLRPLHPYQFKSEVALARAWSRL